MHIFSLKYIFCISTWRYIEEVIKTRSLYGDKCYIVERRSDKKLVGVIAWKKTKVIGNVKFEKDLIMVKSLSIAVEARRKGLAKMLLQKVESDAKKLQLDVGLETVVG